MGVLYNTTFLICGPKEKKDNFLKLFNIEWQKEVLLEGTDFFQVVKNQIQEKEKENFVYFYFSDSLKHDDIIKNGLIIIKDLCTKICFGFLGYILCDYESVTSDQIDNMFELHQTYKKDYFNDVYNMYNKIYPVHEITLDI